MATSASASGFLAQATAEIRAALDAHESRKAERDQLRRPIAMIDDMLSTLEDMNLKGISRVPLAYEPRLLQLRATLRETAVTPEQLDGLRTRVRIARLMDSLYTLQETLFAELRPDIPREPDGWDRPRTVIFDDSVEVPNLFSAA
jgi:hypothetical protein